MIFHEEVLFRQTQELSKEDEEPPSNMPDLEVQMEEEEFETQIPYMPKEPESLPEELLEAPSKRRHAWYRETVQEAEKHNAPPKTFRESIRPQKYSGLMS